jgi:hypothetical protein
MAPGDREFPLREGRHTLDIFPDDRGRSVDDAYVLDCADISPGQDIAQPMDG